MRIYTDGIFDLFHRGHVECFKYIKNKIKLYGLIYGFTFVYKGIEYTYVGSSFEFNIRKSEHKSNCYNINRKEYNYKVYKIIKETGIEWDQIEWFILDEYPELTDSKKGSEDSKELTKYETIWYDRINPNLNTNRPSVTKEETRIRNNERILCEVCDCYTSRKGKKRHNRSNKHIKKNNILLINNMVYN